MEKQQNISTFDYGKIPPQAVDVETRLLGALITDKDVISKVVELLHPEVFYKDHHQKIYKAIEIMYNQNIPIDFLTLEEQLKQSGDFEIIGGIVYLMELTKESSTSHTAQQHCLILKEKYFLRELIRLNSEILTDAYDDMTDVFDLIGKYHDNMSKLLHVNFPTKEKATTELFKEFTERTEKAAKNKAEGKVIGVPSSLKALDHITGGWQPSDLIVIAARPGMGKTAFLKACTKEAIKQLQKPVLIFSLEMSSFQLTARIVSEEINMPAQDFLKGNIPANFKDEIDSVKSNYYSKNGKELLIIDDTPALTISQMTHRAKKMKVDNDICLIIIDYIQLAGQDKNVHSNNREQDISAISRGLKSLAKELEIPIIALSQLNREVEKRGGKMKPKLSDLRESGAIEQDADIVIFLYRPRYYYDLGHENMRTVKVNGVEIDSERYAQLIIAKNRNGATGRVHAKFINYLTKFEDWDEDFETADYSQPQKPPF